MELPGLALRIRVLWARSIGSYHGRLREDSTSGKPAKFGYFLKNNLLPPLLTNVGSTLVAMQPASAQECLKTRNISAVPLAMPKQFSSQGGSARGSHGTGNTGSGPVASSQCARGPPPARLKPEPDHRAASRSPQPGHVCTATRRISVAGQPASQLPMELVDQVRRPSTPTRACALRICRPLSVGYGEGRHAQPLDAAEGVPSPPVSEK